MKTSAVERLLLLVKAVWGAQDSKTVIQVWANAWSINIDLDGGRPAVIRRLSILEQHISHLINDQTGGPPVVSTYNRIRDLVRVSMFDTNNAWGNVRGHIDDNVLQILTVLDFNFAKTEEPVDNAELAEIAELVTACEIAVTKSTVISENSKQLFRMMFHMIRRTLEEIQIMGVDRGAYGYNAGWFIAKDMKEMRVSFNDLRAQEETTCSLLESLWDKCTRRFGQIVDTKEFLGIGLKLIGHDPT